MKLIAVLLFSTINLYAATDLWVYTSIYKEFIEPIKVAFEKENPGIKVQVFQAGSEKLQTKVEAELMAQKPQADIILASDPFWPEDLTKRKLINTSDVNYNSLMILISQNKISGDQRPKSFSDLTKPEFKNLVQMGSPLESGTMFAAVAYLQNKYGWDYFKKLRENKIASQGGNSTVIQKVESGEKKFGMVLLENALAAQKRGSPIDIIYPEDGSIPIPSAQFILNTSPQKEVAQKFAKFILSQDGQKLLVNGYMYSVRKDVNDPPGARPLKDVTKKTTKWTPDLVKKISEASKEIKKQFSEIVLN